VERPLPPPTKSHSKVHATRSTTAGITKLVRYGLHALRHACASLWIEQGHNPKQIQKLMGHSSI
jgi:integrase